MSSYRWLWERGGSLPRNTIQETTSTCRVACGKTLPFLLIPCSRRREVEYTNLFTVRTPWSRNTETGCFNYPRHTISCTKCLAGSPFDFQFWRQKENHSRRFKKNGARWLTSDTLLLCARLCVSAMHKPFNVVDLYSNMKGLHRVKNPATQQVFMWKT